MKYQTVLVTGGTGYIGAWLVKELLEKGYTVRMTVRDTSRKEKYQKLEEIGRKAKGKLEIWEADLLKEGSYNKAAKGADAVIHVASPFKLRIKDAQKELLDPALLGTRNVLKAASASGTIKKVVLTSSVAAISGDNKDMKDKGLAALTEEHFNTSSSAKHQPYSYSKLIAEKEAWKIAKEQNQWNLVVINPSFVMGPALTHSSESESINFMKDILKGKFFFGAPDLYFGFVDVRDVAHAHVLALENDDASGRYILAERCMGVMDLCAIIGKQFPGKYRLPKMKAPKPLLMLIGGLFGVTPKFVKRNVGYPIRYDTTRSQESLGLTYRSMADTVREMVLGMSE